jgi:hypothetical protein
MSHGACDTEARNQNIASQSEATKYPSVYFPVCIFHRPRQKHANLCWPPNIKTSFIDEIRRMLDPR